MPPLTLTTLPPELFAIIISFLPANTTSASDSGSSYTTSICSIAFSQAALTLPITTNTTPLSTPVKPLKTTSVNPFTSLRLVSKSLAEHPLLFVATFNYILTTWLEENISHRMVSEAGSLLCVYPSAAGGWSPWGLEERAGSGDYDTCDERREHESEKAFAKVVWRLAVGWPFKECADSEGVGLTFENFAVLSEREGYSEKKLRMGMSRLRLYRRLMKEETW